MPLAQPDEQLPGRLAVVPVVVADAREDRRALPGVAVALLDPARVLDDRLRRGGDVARARRAIEVLDVLQRIARLADPDRLRHDAVQVDEHLRPQQRVDLLLARAVLPHEATQRSHLVAPVVEDVHRRVREVARVEPVDERLEGSLLARSIVPPEVPERRRTFLDHGGAEEVLEPPFEERVALHVEVDVHRGRGRQERGPLACRLGSPADELVERRDLVLRVPLQPRLSPQAAEDRGVELRDALDLRLRQRSQRGDARVTQTARLVRRDAGDAARVIHLFEDRVRLSLPAAVIGARVGNGALVSVESALRFEEATLEGGEVEEVVVRPKRHLLGRAVDDEQSLRPHPLQVLEHLRVGAELEEKVRLRVASELRVGDVVAEGAEHRRRLDAVEEVGVAGEVAVTERALIDDVVPGAHPGERGLVSAFEGVELARRLPHVLAGGPERGDVTLLVLLAHAREELHLRRRLVGHLRAGALDAEPVHPRGEGALEEATEIPRREDQLARAPLHRRSLFRARVRQPPAREDCRADRAKGACDWRWLGARARQ